MARVDAHMMCLCTYFSFLAWGEYIHINVGSMLARSNSWACKSLRLWDEQEYSSHIFFCAVTKNQNFLKAESGGKEANDKTI